MGNGYKIQKKLGEGGFGIVYLVEKDNKQYALKQCKVKLNKDEIDQYKKIIDILSKINNANLIKYYNLSMKGNTLNLLMEYGGDMDLKKFIKSYKNKSELIDEDIIIDIILQICKGLKEIHKNKIIHRDLTPDNIFIDNNYKIKIGYFGVSKITTTLNKYTKSQIGKTYYIAPEILKGTEYNNKVDIYSLGCIIYELFTLNEYYIDKLDEKDCKINTEIYNSKYQELIDLLLKKDYHERPNIEEVIEYIIRNINYIIAEINIEEDINKDIRFINSYEEYFRTNPGKLIENDTFKNEEEIKKCKIKINDELIPFNYYHKFASKGKYIIKYSFKNNLKNICLMFGDCKLLTNINLSNFNTNNATNMNGMFYGCSSLTKIDLSNFDTKKVTDMGCMFDRCSSLTNINLSNFNTNNVTEMSGMFYGCLSLTNINLSNFNTNNVTKMCAMFQGCSSLTNINLSNFNTNNVTNMNGMFYGCSSLTNINLSNFNTNNVTNILGMFGECPLLNQNNIIIKDKRILDNKDIYFKKVTSISK